MGARAGLARISQTQEVFMSLKTFIGAAHESGLKRRSEEEAAEVELFHRPERAGRR